MRRGEGKEDTYLTEAKLSLLLRAVDFPGGAGSKESACQCRRHKSHGFHP